MRKVILKASTLLFAYAAMRGLEAYIINVLEYMVAMRRMELEVTRLIAEIQVMQMPKKKKEDRGITD